MTKRIAKSAGQPKPKTKAAPKRAPRSAVPKESRYRAAMRERGFRLLSIWVPDTRNAKFRAELRRQSVLIARTDSAADHALLDAALDDIEGWVA
jgi:hypothetical protein